MQLNMRQKVLDHGYVDLLNISGPVRRTHTVFDADDVDIAQAARMSFDQRGTERTTEQDLRLVRYLIENNHTTPLEMIQVWIEMKLPIFLARQFMRHRTASVSEVSARYSTLPNEYYIPTVVGAKSKDKKQGQEPNLNEQTQEMFITSLDSQCRTSYSLYKSALEKRVAPEHARLFLHVNHYTKILWRQDLHNLIHFLKLRTHEHAQVEAREYANAIKSLLSQYLPYVISTIQV